MKIWILWSLIKPSGIVVHPTKNFKDGTIGNAIAYHAKEYGEDYKIRFVNRLDRDTTGLLIIAKNGFAQQFIQDQMEARKVEKIYKALVEGIVEKTQEPLMSLSDYLMKTPFRGQLFQMVNLR